MSGLARPRDPRAEGSRFGLLPKCDRCGHAAAIHDRHGCPMLGCRCPLTPQGPAPLDEAEARAAWGDR